MKGGRPGRGPFLASVLLHVGAVGAIVVVSAQAAPALPPMRVYRVSISSPPPKELGAPTPAVAAPKKKAPPKPPPKKKEKPAPPKPKPQPKPVHAKRAPKRTVKAVQPRAPKDTAKPKTRRKPSPSKGSRPSARSAGGEGLNVDIKGEEFPYPDYLENIILQVRRYFRWTGAPGLRTRVYFVIHRDGSVSDIRILQTSGDRIFDFQALGAVEVAGKRGAFGKLPKGYQGDVLPVDFFVDAR